MMYPFQLRDYFVFSGTRNPWDRAVSEFHFYFQQYTLENFDFKQIKATFSEYIFHESHLRWDRRLGGFFTGNMRNNHLAQDYLYRFYGKNCADYVFRYENLDNDLLELGKHLKLDKPLKLPKKRIKGGLRIKGQHWREYYDDESRDLIARCCRKEIEMYGYSFQD